MATVTGFTSTRMLAIEQNAIVGGSVVGDNLILTRQSGATINAGNVRGATGSPGITNAELTAGLAGAATVTNLNTEITNRTNADNTLQANINTEATARSNADALEASIRLKYAKGLANRIVSNAYPLTLTNTGAMQDVPGSTISFTCVNGRRYRLKVRVQGQCSGGPNGATGGTISITDSANTYIDSNPWTAYLGNGGRFFAECETVWTATFDGGPVFKSRIFCLDSNILFTTGLNAAPFGTTYNWLEFTVDDIGAP